MTKACSKCGETKPTADFYHCRGRIRPECKACNNASKAALYAADSEVRARIKAQARAWAVDNPERVKELKTHARFTQYGMTEEEFVELLRAQGGCCAICGTTEPNGKHKAWVIDHDHETSAVRGVLCNSCNIGIGMLKDNPAVVRAAAEYLTQPPTSLRSAS